MESFGLAWTEAVSLCLERRMSGGHTPEEVMGGVVGELELDKIYMTAVDTGWCTDERPHRQAQHEADGGFVVPLTTEDGAARVYHPILHGMKENNLPYFSVFLKNFKPHPW